jgi:tRNA (guanine-N7-)-methyltransferase
MQHDPLSSKAKILPLPQENGGSDPNTPEKARPTTSSSELENDDDDFLDDTSDPESAQPIMRDRFFRRADHSVFLEWINTEIPLELEIGSGKGLFLTNASARSRNRRFVGLELAAKYALDCQSRVEKSGIPNAKFFACDAVAVLDQDVADSSLDAIHVYFPDPWWKSRHKKRRVLNEKSLCNIERTLKPSGSLHFWTDVLDYYEGTLELIDQVTKLKGPLFVSEPPAAHDMDYLTHFERRTRRNGLPVYRSRFTKIE